MPETTTTTLTELVETEVIADLVLWYQYDNITFVPFARHQNLADGRSSTASFPRWVKDAHTDLATETTDLTAETLETTDVQVTCARVGIAREVTETSFEDTILGRAALMDFIATDAAILFGMAADEDLAAEFANASNAVSDTTQDLEILDLVEAMALQRAAKVRGPQVFNLHDRQLGDLQRAQVAAVATPWGAFYKPVADHANYGGTFMNADIFSSSLNPTANAGADRVGSLHAMGQQAPRFAAYAYAVKRALKVKMEEKALEDSTIVAFTARYGVGTIAADFATSITTDA